ncbi:glyoxal oxidase-related protein [Abeliophyllum distichum]|uniref:Glyoxal oxidase-related protein n=1 Tax=Abeliophyllum distichum TaxID=126358 RepID=A0ABD1RUB0_9LAMI
MAVQGITPRQDHRDVVVNQPNSIWEMEDMPFGRIMGDMVVLPAGDVLIINGAQAETQGIEMASQLDGRVLFAESNPHYFFSVEFPIKLRIKAFSPKHLSLDKANIQSILVDVPEKVVGKN